MRSVCFSFHSLRLRPSAVILSSDLSPPEIAVSSHNRLPGRPSPSPDPPQQTDTSNSKDPNVTNIADHNATLPSPVEQENTICTKRTLLPLTQNAWELAVERCIDKLKPEDKITVLQWKRDQILSAEDVDEIVRPLKERYASSRSFRCISSSYPFLEHLRSFSTVIDVCVQTNPNPGALIWGCVKLVLEVATRSIQLFELINDMLESSSSQFPLFESWLRLFPESDHSEIFESVVEACHEYLEFLVHATNYLKSSQAKNMLKGATLPKFQRDFERHRERIRRLTDNILVQVHTAGLVASDRRHQELRGLIASAIPAFPNQSVQVSRSIYFLQDMLRNNRFFGRKQELAAIDEALQKDGERMTSVAIYGIGGSGKSTLALEYAYLKRDRYDMIAWLHADSRSKLEDQFGQLAIECGFVSRGNSLDCVHDTVLNWLATSSIKWLLIYDNADHADVLPAFWPKATRGSIITTSRDPTINRPGLAADKIKLDTFQIDEGRAFLMSQLSLAKDDLGQLSGQSDAIDELVREFGGLPIGLATVAAYMDAKQHSPSSYLRLCKQKRESGTASGTLEIGRNLQTMWDVSLATLTVDGEEYLNHFAFLDPDRIDMELFNGRVTLTSCHQAGLQDFEAEERLHDALANLTQQSLIEVNRIARTIKIHRYLQSAIRERIRTSPSKHERVFRECLSLIRAKLPRTEFGYHRKPEFWDIRRACGPHVDVLCARLSPDFDDSTAGLLLDLLADHAFFHGETYQVELAFSTLNSAKTIMKGRQVDQRTLSFLLYTEGLICNDTNRLEEALQNFSQAREVLEQAMDQEVRNPMDKKNLSHIYSSMGNALTGASRFVDAKASHHKAVSLYLAAGEIVDERLGRLYANLGSCLLWEGDLAQAESTLHKALLHYDRKLCCTLYALGNVYLAQNRIQRAYETHMEILEIFSKRLGRSHLVTADSCFKVGCILSREDFPNAHLGRAMAYLRTALAIYEACASKSNQDSKMLVARAQFKLATVLERMPATAASQTGHLDETSTPAHKPEDQVQIQVDGLSSPAKLKELGLQALRDRLGPAERLPDDSHAVMAMFDRRVFYWSR